MFDFDQNDDQQLTPRRPRAGMSNLLDIAAPGPQRAPAELPAIDVPARSTQPGGQAEAQPRQPQIASPVTNVTDVTSGRKPAASMGSPARASRAGAEMAGPTLDQDVNMHQNRLNSMRESGSGISQIHNPFLRTLARVGDIAGTALMPNVTRLVPGTELRHRDLMRQETGAITQDLGQQHSQAQAEQERAGAAHQNAETEKIEHELNAPEAQTPEEQAFAAELKKNGGDAMAAFKALKSAGQKPPEPKEGELPLGERVGQLNDMLKARYQVLNPGQELPPQYLLPANATQKDYDRVDKSLEAEERARGTKAQQDTANEIRRQTAELTRQNAQERQDKEGLQPVIGNDPATGRRVLVPLAEAKKMGLTSLMKADVDMANKSEAAKHWIQLADKQGDSPQTMGIVQLIDKMEREGKLGIAASRWNEFMAGRIGNGDPEFTALRAKIALGNTKLMQAHVGSRGGSFMLEHFEDLANAKKMDAATLRSGILSELDYMKDVAMAPEPAQGGGGGTQMIRVQIPGHKPGQIPASARAQFLKDNPNAKVLE